MSLSVDIVSDVVCPWCYVGLRQLELAAQDLQQDLRLTWHPFELNPTMPPEGENLRDHIMTKYGSTRAQSDEARARLSDLGDTLGITFAFTEDSRMVNTFHAHQLLDWAGEEGVQTDLKRALLHAYFTEGRDVGDHDVLCDVAASCGLDPAAARDIVTRNTRMGNVRNAQKHWHQQGITGVPGMIFQQKYLVTGAQGVDGYHSILTQLRAQAR